MGSKDLKSLLSEIISGKEISEYHLKLLQKHNVRTPSQFVDAKNLHKILALDIEHIELMKKEMLTVLLESVKLKDVYQSQPVNYTTGIQELDALLEAIEQQLRSGRLWELYGECGVGKSQLFYTLATNFVVKYPDNVLFIDSKHDFDCVRVHDMLAEKQLDSSTVDDLMERINVFNCNSSCDLLAGLESMLDKIANKDELMCSIKLVIIDSLAASFMLFRSTYDRNEGRKMLSKLAMLLRTLAAQHGIAFIIGNLTFSDGDEDEELEYDIGPSQRISQMSAMKNKSLLGEYWDSVCTLSLSLEQPDESNNNIRILKVLSNSYGPSGGNCVLRIADAGVI